LRPVFVFEPLSDIVLEELLQDANQLEGLGVELLLLALEVLL